MRQKYLKFGSPYFILILFVIFAFPERNNFQKFNRERIVYGLDFPDTVNERKFNGKRKSVFQSIHSKHQTGRKSFQFDCINNIFFFSSNNINLHRFSAR